MPEMCCTPLAENTGRKNDAKNRHLGTIAQLCRAMSSQLRQISTVVKNLLSSNISSTCPHNMVNFGPLAAEIDWRVWDTPAKIQRLSRLGFATAATSLNGSQPNFARCLAVSCAGRLFIHFRRLLPHNGILPGAKFTLRPPSLALSYIGSVTTRHSSSGHKPNLAPPVFIRATITLGIGPHSSWLCF